MFNEDLSVFLTDFGVSCTSGATTAMGILDMPGQVIADGMVINTDYTLTARTADFGSLLYGDGITVDGISYQVREARKLDDGFFSELMLSKIEPSFYRLMLQNGDSLLLEDGYRILLEA